MCQECNRWAPSCVVLEGRNICYSCYEKLRPDWWNCMPAGLDPEQWKKATQEVAQVVNDPMNYRPLFLRWSIG